MAEKRLYRSTNDRVIAGVCGGIAEYFDLDPKLVRVVYFLALVIPGGIGIIPYIALWIVLPEGPEVGASSSAVVIAEERYARGEITAEELERIRADLSA